MLRLRRYRVFLIIAVLTILGLYKFRDSILDDAISAEEYLRKPQTDKSSAGTERDAPQLQVPINQVVHEEKKIDVKISRAESPGPRVTPPPVEPGLKPVQAVPEPDRKQHPAADLSAPRVPEPYRGGSRPPPPSEDQNTDTDTSTKVILHWTAYPENYPVPSASTRQLPTGTPKPIPKIQKAKFAKESKEQKADREGKLAAIKQEFVHAWSGYTDKAWLHDEIKPVTGATKDPFAGWGATLVDALDTLWIMGLEKEFDLAVEEGVKKVDFTTSTANAIPVFETTIRYLGGLIAAYDVSGQKYKALLDKAVELGDVLMGAFDTPNRMPVLYYNWQPRAARQKKRASSAAVLAEIGSLAMEFTRLAQLTKEPKYYDAIDRITDNLRASQMESRMPGMWPVHVDASGCNKTEVATPATGASQVPANAQDAANFVPLNKPEPWAFDVKKGDAGDQAPIPGRAPGRLSRIAGWDDPKGASEEDLKDMGLNLDPPQQKSKPNPQSQTAGNRGRIQGWDQGGLVDETVLGKLAPGTKQKRQDFVQFEVPEPVADSCIDDGYISAHLPYGSDQFTLGGMSDSTYEYLPKQWLLLGGLEPKYKEMYERSYEAFNKYLLFRTMLPDEKKIILGSGSMSVSGELRPQEAELEPEGSHLTCFVGGMYGLGAQIFEHEEQLKLAEQLTEGCVWAYNVTKSGIMPEGFMTAACPNIVDCPWNQTRYDAIVDPYAASRFKTYEDSIERYNEQIKDARVEAKKAVLLAQSDAGAIGKSQNPSAAADLNRRQLDAETTVGQAAVELEDEDLDPEEREFRTRTQYLFKPTKPQTHEEYMEMKLTEENLPLGMTVVKGRNYILRPEAIESVFYMYRITGNQHWREVGWTMFENIIKATRSKFGHSAIADVLKAKPSLEDSMESFWLAETLKYFYLLFAEESVVSLDEWVFNTEAHPFKRPTKPF